MADRPCFGKFGRCRYPKTAICITRRGKPVARLVPVERPREPFDWDALNRHTDNMTYQTESAGDFIR